jgi:predicted transcriptional regulator
MSVDEKPKKGANKPVKLTPLDPAVEKIMERLREDVAKGKI